MDALVLGCCVLYKQEQPAWREKGEWRRELQLD
jgi:hypothetical protein